MPVVLDNDPGDRVALYLWDGSAWVKGAQSLFTQIIGRNKTYVAHMDQSIAAGGNADLLATTSGKGNLFYASIFVNGVALAARDTVLEIYVDGESSPSLSASLPVFYERLLGTRLADLTDIGVALFDDGAFDYKVWLNPHLRFATSLRLNVLNGDGANAVTVAAGALYTLET